MVSGIYWGSWNVSPVDKGGVYHIAQCLRRAPLEKGTLEFTIVVIFIIRAASEKS